MVGNKSGGRPVWNRNANVFFRKTPPSEKSNRNIEMNKKEKLLSTVSPETQPLPPTSEDSNSLRRCGVKRRSFLKGLGMAGATLLPASALLMTNGRAQADERNGAKANSQRVTSPF
jgi:hypothetical protein